MDNFFSIMTKLFPLTFLTLFNEVRRFINEYIKKLSSELQSRCISSVLQNYVFWMLFRRQCLLGSSCLVIRSNESLKRRTCNTSKIPDKKKSFTTLLFIKQLLFFSYRRLTCNDTESSDRNEELTYH